MLDIATIEKPKILNPITRSATTTAKPRPKILVAEDSADTRIILTRTLEFENYDYLTASTGEEALELVKLHKPDLMLLDLMLPKMNGFQVLMRLKNLDIRTKVCVISAIDKEDFIRRALDFGAVDYIVKPIFPDAMSHKVKKLLGEECDLEPYFRNICSLSGKVDCNEKSYECHIKRISEAALTFQTAAPLCKGDVVSISCPALSRVLERSVPIFVRINGMRGGVWSENKFDFDGEIVGMSETQRQKLRAEVIRGKYISDETFLN